MKKWLAVIALCWTVPAAPDRVIDGDTFLADVYLWPSSVAGQPLRTTERIRVLGVNTPEKSDFINFMASLEFTRGWLSIGDVSISTCGRDSFGRILGHVTRDGRTLAADLQAAQLGVDYKREFPVALDHLREADED